MPGLHLVDPDPANLAGQVIYLDFDGREDVTYDGPVSVGPFDIPAFQAPDSLAGQEPAIIGQVLANLEQTFAASGVVFTVQPPPDGAEHSTIYIGGDDLAFSEYGSFLGLAEQVDAGNRSGADEAIVFTESLLAGARDAAQAAALTAQVVAHEAGHLLGMSHLHPAGAGPLASVAHFAGPDDGQTAAMHGPVHQWLTYNAFLFYDSQFVGPELADFLGDWEDYGSLHHQSNGDDNDVIEGTFDEDVSYPITYLFDDGFHWDLARIAYQNPLGQSVPYLRHFVAGGDGDEIYDGWSQNDSAVTQADAYWDDYVLGNYPTDKALSYYYLGHVTHLLEDMTVPAHVHNDAHPIRDAYEHTMGEYGNYLLWAYDGTRTSPVGETEVPASLLDLFRETINYTEEYDSNGAEGDWDPDRTYTGTHRPDLVSRSGGFTGDGQDLDPSSTNEISMIADDLMPWAMEQVASLFRLFYNYVDDVAPTVNWTTSFGSSATTAVQKDGLFTATAEAQDAVSGYDRDGFRFEVQIYSGGAWRDVLAGDPNSGTDTIALAGDGLYRARAAVQDGGGNLGRSDYGYFYVGSFPMEGGLQPVHRFYSPVSDHHFYTIDDQERQWLVDNFPDFWSYEGVAYYAYATDAEPGLVPVYRFWSATLGSHFYTTNQAERDWLISDHADVWAYENTAFYTYGASPPTLGGRAVHRFWSATLGGHFYTTEDQEKDWLIANFPHVWTYESTAWYVDDL